MICCELLRLFSKIGCNIRGEEENVEKQRGLFESSSVFTLFNHLPNRDLALNVHSEIEQTGAGGLGRSLVLDESSSGITRTAFFGGESSRVYQIDQFTSRLSMITDLGFVTQSKSFDRIPIATVRKAVLTFLETNTTVLRV